MNNPLKRTMIKFIKTIIDPRQNFRFNKFYSKILGRHNVLSSVHKLDRKKQFMEAMVTEFDYNPGINSWKVVTMNNFPTGTSILDSIWSMKQKRDILYCKMMKWKSRLTLNGGKQYRGVK